LENIDLFINACRQYGVPKHLLFQTVDLYEQRDIPKVISCLLHLQKVTTPMIESYKIVGGREGLKKKKVEGNESWWNGRSKKVWSINRRSKFSVLISIGNWIIGPFICGVVSGFGIRVGHSLFQKQIQMLGLKRT